MRPLINPTLQATVGGVTGYRRIPEIVVSRGGDSVTLRPVSGSITYDSRTTQRWSGSVVVHVDDDLVPSTPADILQPFGSQVLVFLGVSNGDVSEAVEFGVMEIAGCNVSLGPSGAVVSLSLVDQANRVAANRFARPFRVARGLDLAEVAAAVVSNRAPVLDPGDDLPLTGSTLSRAYVFGAPENAANTDPWAEMQQVLNTRGFNAWFDRDGSLVVGQKAPTLGPIRAVDPATVTSASNDQPENVVVARGQTDTGGAALGIWEDDDPTSPTFVDGPYGRRTRFYASPLLASNEQAAQAAASIGRTLQARGAAWTVTRPYDPTWDPWDGASFVVGGEPTLAIVDAVTVDMAGPTTLVTSQWVEDAE